MTRRWCAHVGCRRTDPGLLSLCPDHLAELRRLADALDVMSRWDTGWPALDDPEVGVA